MSERNMTGSQGRPRQSSIFLVTGGKTREKEKREGKAFVRVQHAPSPPWGLGEKICKDHPENGLSGFLKELSWGSKQHDGFANEVMTDGISRAWHNSHI